jgi:hypothetical protein
MLYGRTIGAMRAKAVLRALHFNLWMIENRGFTKPSKNGKFGNPTNPTNPIQVGMAEIAAP